MPGSSRRAPATTGTRDLVRLARDTAYDRYLQALLVKPKTFRTDFLVLAAFHGELARIPLVVREPMMGEIRLQWWQDTIAATEFVADDTMPNFGSPLANHIAHVIARFPESCAFFLSAIEARRAELDPHAITDAPNFDRYLTGVGGALLNVGCLVLGIEQNKETTEALCQAGRAIAAADLAVRLPRLASLGRMPHIVPKSTDAAAGDDGATNLVSEHQISCAVDVLNDKAVTSLNAYRAIQPKLPTQLTHAVLPLALVEPYFQALQTSKSGMRERDYPKSPLARLFTLWWAARRKYI